MFNVSAGYGNQATLTITIITTALDSGTIGPDHPKDTKDLQQCIVCDAGQK